MLYFKQRLTQSEKHFFISVFICRFFEVALCLNLKDFYSIFESGSLVHELIVPFFHLRPVIFLFFIGFQFV